LLRLKKDQIVTRGFEITTGVTAFQANERVRFP
jgi:hypothetical protein